MTTTFALGLTKTAVEGTLSLVKSAVEEEVELKEKVQNDLVFIIDEFEMMRAFLRVANKERVGNDEVVLTWVRQLRNLAFDVEDFVEFVVHLEIKPSSRWDYLRRTWHKVKVYCCAPPLPGTLDLDDAVAEIKQLKARVQDVSQRSTRYNLITHGSNNNNKQQPAATAVTPLAEQPENATAYPSSASFHILRDAWEASGKWHNNMSNLQELIAHGGEGEHDDDDLHVISVWGSSTGGGEGGGGADLGTASIFRKAYRDPKICEKFKTRAWVKLMHPFNQDEFVKSLLAQFSVSVSHQSNADGVDFSFTRMKAAELMEADNLMKAMLMVMEQRFLVILEDVFTLEEWDVIRVYLPDNKNGSQIVVSTPHLGIALMCAGEPYQVSELRKFPAADNQFLCAFFKNKTQRDMGEFDRQLRRHAVNVISVWGVDDESSFVDILYKGLINGWFREFEGVVDADKADHVGMLLKGIRNRMSKLEVEFKQHSWVDVPYPFNLKVFAQRLFLNFHSDNIRAGAIRNVGMEGEGGLIQWCREFLSGEDYLVVINGLKSKDDWELIKDAFSLSKLTANKGCILVITNEETVATHCVKDHKYEAFNVKDLEADTSIATVISKLSWNYGIGGLRGRLFYDRRKDAREWKVKFNNVADEGKYEEKFGVFIVDLGRYRDPWSSILLRGILGHAYYGAFQQIERRSWVDVTYKDGQFMDTDFAWRLLLDFYSDDPQAKEKTAVGLMEGTITNPIQECLEILRNKKCLVVIHGLGPKDDWDWIKGTFFSEQHNQSIIIVTASHGDTYCNPKLEEWFSSTRQGLTYIYKKEYVRLFYTERCQKAFEWTDKFELVGREREVSHLFRSIRTLGQHLLSVWGIPGVGKSYVVRDFYYYMMAHSAVPALYDHIYYFEAFGWVDVPSPFNLTEFTWRLLLDLYSDDPQAKQIATVSMMEEGQVPILECCKILREKICLVVIDGLRSTQDWDLIKDTLLSKRTRSFIVVITTEEKVAMHCVENYENQEVLNIRRLEADAALNLLKKISSEDEQLTSEVMVSKCGGLPKVIAAIGKLRRSYNNWLLCSLRDNFMGTLETAPEFNGLRPLFSWMQSYFDACSDSIKPCIFYLSIFSAEKNIRLRRLLWRWIAEGYCRDTSDGRTCEENAEKFISELTDLSIIQQSPSSKVSFGLEISREVFCQINGFFHEYIISRPMEDKLVFALEGCCRLNSQRGGQHLTIRSSWDRRDRIVYESIDFSRLRSLTVAGKWEPFFISSKNIDMRLLRVLDLEDATDVTNEDLEQIAKLLRRLKFLSVRGHTKINCLPSSIGGLRQLQTLDIRHTSIVMLPPGITELQKLRYLRAGTSTTEVWDWNEGDLLVPADGEEDMASAAAQATNLPTTLGTPTEDEDNALDGDGGDDRASSFPEITNLTDIGATPIEDEEHTSEPQENGVMNLPTDGGTNSTAPVLAAAECCRPLTFVSSLLSKLCRRRGLDNNGGVKVPAGIGKLSVIHTLGVVKVSAQCSKDMAIFEELKKLTQLHKLGVSGINTGNIMEFCSAISDLSHLKSLLVELDQDDDKLDALGENDILKPPPKSIKSLKLYGRVHKLLLVWMHHLNHLERLKLDVTIEKPEELRELPPSPNPRILRNYYLRIRPIQDGELQIGDSWIFFTNVLEVQCSSDLRLTFVNVHITEVLKVYFSSSRGSISEISGLNDASSLKEVWLKGHNNAHKQYMKHQINEMRPRYGHDQMRPVLKLVRSF